MAGTFVVFPKSKFEYELSSIRHSLGLGYWEDVTDYISERSGVRSWEHIYQFPTNIGGLKILIYSSIDVSTGYTRDIGSDAVRVCYMWENRNGTFFYHIRKHLRVVGLFGNLKRTLYCWSNIPYEEVCTLRWSKEMDEAG